MKAVRLDFGEGPPCPSCGVVTARYRWDSIERRQAETGRAAYQYWYECLNDKCRTKQIMPPEAKVEDVDVEDRDAREHFKSI